MIEIRNLFEKYYELKEMEEHYVKDGEHYNPRDLNNIEAQIRDLTLTGEEILEMELIPITDDNYVKMSKYLSTEERRRYLETELQGLKNNIEDISEKLKNI